MKNKKNISFIALILAVVQSIFFLFPFTAMAEEKPVIITSFYPIYAMVVNLTHNIDEVQVQNLAQVDTGCLHDYQLVTQDLKTLSKGQALCINGAGMESFLQPVMQQFPALPIIDASTGIPLLIQEDQGEAHHHTDDQGDDHDHMDNPHLWLDVKNTIKMVENLSKGLQSTFPQLAQDIGQNEKEYVLRLEALDETLKEGLKDLPNREIITFHEAFPYFAKAYNFNILAVITQEPEESLNPRELAEVITIVGDHPGISLFVEPQYSNLAAQTIAQQTGARIYTLDPLVTGKEENALTYYIDGMLENMKTLQEALN